MNGFSFTEYREVLDTVNRCGGSCGFQDALGKESFIILRHDVEFSPERAYRLSLLETECGVRATYFFQISNHTYNAFSDRNIAFVEKMRSNGHAIGLHVRLDDSMTAAEAMKKIEEESHIMGYFFGFPIDSFSIHRPSSYLLSLNLKHDRFLNAYQDEFFTFFGGQPDQTVDIKYISDAQHKWNYGVPEETLFFEYPKVQLLAHPDYWMETEAKSAECFAALLSESIEDQVAAIKCECKHFTPDEHEIRQLLYHPNRGCEG